MASNTINFPGTHQTTYSDWAKTVISRYPSTARYSVESYCILVYSGTDVVGEYNFQTGKGYVVENILSEVSETLEIDNFTEFDVDNLMYK